MARVKTELKRTFGKVKEPIKVRKFLKLTEFTDELIDKAKADFELIISDSKKRTIVFHGVKCKLPPKCFILLEMLLMYGVLEFDAEKSILTFKKTKEKFIRTQLKTWHDDYGRLHKVNEVIDPIKSIEEIVHSYDYTPKGTSKSIHKLKTYLEKAFISAGKTMADLDNVFPILISTHECAKKDVNYSVRTRYIYGYQKS